MKCSNYVIFMGVVFWHREFKMLAYRSCESYWCWERIISRSLCFCKFCHSWNEARVKLQLQCVVSKLIMVELTHSLWWSLWVTCYGINDWVCNLLREKPCVFCTVQGRNNHWSLYTVHTNSGVIFRGPPFFSASQFCAWNGVNRLNTDFH